MRACWIDASNDADWAKMAANSMTALYYPVSDPIEDVRRRISDTKAHSYVPGVYMAWNWPAFDGLAGVDMAELMHSLVAQIEQGIGPVKVQFDYEAHTPVQIRGMLSRFRALRPKQDISWTMEAFQGSWMTVEFVQALIALKVRIVPQLYRHPASGKDMADKDDYKDLLSEQIAQDVALKDLLKRGFPFQSVSGFYDAAALPAWWDGFAFTMGRLP
jgi:hypothetical protein